MKKKRKTRCSHINFSIIRNPNVKRFACVYRIPAGECRNTSGFFVVTHVSQQLSQTYCLAKQAKCLNDLLDK